VSRSVYVSDYSVRGSWVQISHPGGKITLPKKELSAVDPFYRDEVFTLAAAVCQEHARRWGDAWKYRLVGEDPTRHLVEFMVEVSVVTTPRTLPQKIQEAQFSFQALWWLDGDQLRVMEWGRQPLWESAYNTPSEGPLTEDHIPASVIQRMLLELPKVSSYINDEEEVLVVSN